MITHRKVRNFVLGFWLVAAAIIVDGWVPGGFVIKDAEARFGRPLTPVSVAGVARRTTRRTIIRRSAVYVSTLPQACSTVIIDGTSLMKCGVTYYQPAGAKYVVVNID